MQNIIIEKPYRFIPPHRGTFWSWFIQRTNLHGRYLRKNDGVVDWECRGTERLQQSLDAGHGILLTPNHCRLADPLVLGWLIREAGCHVYAMASWHLFQQTGFESWAIRRMGGFSVYREGVDRQAISTAIEILDQAERPLVIFPEGAVSRTNDRLHALLDGVAFIARTAAKRRQRRVGGRVVLHPVAIKYLFQGNIDRAADDVLTEIEQRLSWRSQKHLNTPARIFKVGQALLALKEMEHLNQTYGDGIGQRMRRLTEHLLVPLEQEWLGGEGDGPVVPRVKAVRMQILPAMVRNELDEAERQRRWNQLEDLYLAQQISCYPADYLEYPSIDRLLETIERYEADLTGSVRVHGSLKAVMEVGEVIEVSPERRRGVKVDPLMPLLADRLQGMLDRLAEESARYGEGPGPVAVPAEQPAG